MSRCCLWQLGSIILTLHHQQTMIAIFVFLQLALVILWASKLDVKTRKVGLTASSLSFVASLALLSLSNVEHTRSLSPSVLLNAYLFFTLIFDAVALRTLWRSSFSVAIRGLSTASFVLKFVLVFLEAVQKRKYFKKNYRERSPEESSGFFSQGLLWWLNDIILLGSRRLLKPNDLYPISRDLRSERLSRAFWNAWVKREVPCSMFDRLTG
jgi:ATP-binding cassette, subfamily C (CFTR/MRP), member 1